MPSQLISAIRATPAGFANKPPLEYKKSCVVELPFTIVRGCRTFIALDSDGYAICHGILEPGGNMAGLAADLRGLLKLLDTGPARPTLQLVRD